MKKPQKPVAPAEMLGGRINHTSRQDENPGKNDSAVTVARINAKQAIVVALISSAATLAVGFATLIVRGNMDASHERSQSPASAAVPDGAGLHYEFRWVYLDKSIDDNKCVDAAVRGLESRDTREMTKSTSGTGIFAHDESTEIIIACQAKHGVALITAAGPTSLSSLGTLTNDIKTRMDAELQPR
jgi:hypothetical protein